MIWVESVQLFACVLVFIFSSIFAFAFFRSAGAKIHLSSRALTHMKVTSRHSFTLFLEQYAPETTFHVGICLLADQPKLAKKMWVSFLQLFRSARTSCTTSVPLDQLYSYINHHRTIPSLVFFVKNKLQCPEKISTLIIIQRLLSIYIYRCSEYKSENEVDICQWREEAYRYILHYFYMSLHYSTLHYIISTCHDVESSCRS